MAWTVLRPMRFIRTLGGLFRALVREDQQQLSSYLLATEGDCFERSFREFSATRHGGACLTTLPATKIHLDQLANLPQGSLGFIYREFMKAQGFDEAFYEAEVQRVAALSADEQRRWYRTRLGNMHDLRHLLTGYSPDRLGELCLICFRYGNIGHSGLLTLISVMLLRTWWPSRDRPVLRAMLEAYRRGRQARSLDLVDWEFDRAAPLADHRARLNISPARYYRPCLARDAYLHPAE